MDRVLLSAAGRGSGSPEALEAVLRGVEAGLVGHPRPLSVEGLLEHLHPAVLPEHGGRVQGAAVSHALHHRPGVNLVQTQSQ